MKNKKLRINKIIKLKNKKDINSLYINYINVLVKSETLQNKLENLCSVRTNIPAGLSSKKTKGLNNYLNNLFVKIMLMQNAINYISFLDKSKF